MNLPPLRTGACLAALVVASTPLAAQTVVINELSSASNERMLRWLPDGSPRLGSGAPWHSGGFSDAGWSSGAAPFGWGTTVTTPLQSVMSGRTPSLYVRKTFTATAAQAALNTPIVLLTDYDDGFVAYLNGIEIARANAGPRHHFLYAHQPAYNPRVAVGIEEFPGPAAGSILVAGTNVLAIQAHNHSLTGNFRLNAGLKVLTSTTPVTIAKASWNFNNATDASRTHQNAAGAVSNVQSGIPVSGGWLATAPDPLSTAGAGTTVAAITKEAVTGGWGGSGGLSYAFTHTGGDPGISVRAPIVAMNDVWTPFSVSPTTLGTTTLAFRYRTGGGLQFDLRMDPSATQTAASVDGFPRLGVFQTGAVDFDWNTAANGYREMTISATGGQSTSTSGSINISNYDILAGTGCRSGVVRLQETNAAGSGPGGSTGHLTFRFMTYPAVLDAMAFRVNRITATEWPAGQISAAVWANSRLSFRWRLPAGRSADFTVEPTLGITPANTAVIGTLTGTGNWETCAVQLSELLQGEALRLRTNSGSQRVLRLRASLNGTPFAAGEAIDLDSINLYVEDPASLREENAPREFSASAGAYRTLAVDAAGTITQSVSGTPVEATTLFADETVRGMQARLIEDPSAGAANGGGTGYLRCTLFDPPNSAGIWGFTVPGMQVRNWTAGQITADDIANAAMQLAVKIPQGTTVQVLAQPAGGDATQRIALGSLTGNNTWQPKTVEFGAGGGLETFRAALNSLGTNRFDLVFLCPSNTGPGDVISLDNLQVLTWREYSVRLDEGQNQQRFTDALNQAGLAQFVPVFSKVPGSQGGGTLSLDDVQVTYHGPDPAAVQQLVRPGSTGGAWRYFPGLAEPSGGLFDKNLLTGVTVPPGDEDDYDNPQNFRDWLELRNTTAAPVNLANWSLTDDDSLPAKWRFPAGATIPANGYLLVMCDQRNESNGAAQYLHANFELSAGGEKVQLYSPAGALIDEVTGMPEQDTWHSWARNPADNLFAFTETATPGAANAGPFAEARVKAPDFFRADGTTPFPGGFLTGPQTLVLQSETDGAVIRYSLDGSEPTETSGIIFSGPVSLSAPGDRSAVVVRARAFREGRIASETKTHTFLIDQHAALKSMPALLFSGDAGRNFFLPMGILAISGDTSPEHWTPSGPQTYNIPINRGDAYERLITAEYYYPDGRDGWREDVGIRVSSSPFSRSRLKMSQTHLSPFIRDHTQKCSFNLFWRDDYGNSSMNHATIPDTDTRQFRQLRVRAGKNDIANPFFLDELGRRLHQKMDRVQAVGGWNSVYINGSFKGLYNTCERIRESMFQYHHRTDASFDVRYIQDQVDGDSVFWDQMQSALNSQTSAPSPANYQNVLNYLDPEAAADYFLWMVYVNMDDWLYPGFCNNYAAYRERSPAGRYRFLGWDLEAAFGRFGRPVSFDSFNWMLTTANEVSNVFRALYQNPEWKLLFADRIRKHMFHDGALDDRSATAFIKTQKDKYVAEIQPIIRFIENNPSLNLETGWFEAHVHPTTGRRAMLFSTGASGSFRSRGLWPVTEPPAFSQHGGTVAAGYPLVITAPVAGTVYYTTDGTDPRLPGGNVAPGALVYTGPLTLTTLTTVKSRVRSAGGEWSPLTEATFQPGSLPPDSASLVISEIMYRPPDPTEAEVNAGFTDGGDFEFVRLTNISASLLDLRGLAFTAGITFGFANSGIEALRPGASVLVVKRAAAMAHRFGPGITPLIAGEFAGALNNGGEPLRLENGSGNTPVQAFSYNDEAPWPLPPDGFGPSLLLRLSATELSNGDPARWTWSAQPGGLPSGSARAIGYAQWRNLCFPRADVANSTITGPLADPDQDGSTNLVEFALGTPPLFNDRSRLPAMGVESVNGEKFATLEYRLQNGIAGITVAPQSSADMATWESGAAHFSHSAGPVDHGDGTSTWKVRETRPWDAGQRRCLRLHITLP